MNCAAPTGDGASARPLEVPGSSAPRSPPRPLAEYAAARTLDLVRKSLVPATQGMPCRALREQARLLCTDRGEPLGVGLVERNNGSFMGTNNCLFLSLRDLLIPDPPQLRSMLSQLYWDMDPGMKLRMARAILAYVPVDTLHNLPLGELTARCTNHILISK